MTAMPERKNPDVSVPHDYHLHTTFSFDSDQSMSQVCERAIELGIPEIAITEHADFIPDDPGTGFYQPAAFFAEVERCRATYGDRLTLKAGVEIGESHRYPDETRDLLETYPYDFVLGSLHWVGDRMILAHDYFEDRTLEEAYRAYFVELLEMVRHGDFDVIGHIDVGKRYGYEVHGAFDVTVLEEEIRAVLAAAIERGKGIEINHGSLRRKINEPAPNQQILNWYREMGGEILTLGSDGHRVHSIGLRLDEAVVMAQRAGFDAVTQFTRRTPVSVSIAG